jgi:hypothetical protein
MKRIALAGLFTLLGGAAALLLAASILFSCRSGGDPHHSGSAAVHESAPPSAPAAHAPQAAEGTRIALPPSLAVSVAPPHSLQ